jgi:hypothetical protein
VQHQDGNLGHEILKDVGTILLWVEGWDFHLFAVSEVDSVRGYIVGLSTSSFD